MLIGTFGVLERQAISSKPKNYSLKLYRLNDSKVLNSNYSVSVCVCDRPCENQPILHLVMIAEIPFN